MALLVSACLPAAQVRPQLPVVVPTATALSATPTPEAVGTPLPTRAPFGVGQVYTYTAQTGDTLVGLAAHFNTTQAEILSKNPSLAPTATIASGVVLHIPVYWFPLGGTPYKIIPDSELVYGPTSKGFDVSAYIASQPGYLRTLSAFVNNSQRTSGQTVLYVA